MTRIIAGAAGSLRLEVPKAGTRPTSDRVREAVFSTLDSWGMTEGARVLDLYAGSGALGLEAASRGAATVTLVERHPQAAQVAQRNARTVSAAFGRGGSGRGARGAATAPAAPTGAPKIDVVRRSVRGYLESCGPERLGSEPLGSERPESGRFGSGRFDSAQFNVVLIDPPYELGEAELAGDLESLIPLLAPGAVVLVERSSRSPEPGWPPGLQLVREKRYGETVLWWAESEQRPEPENEPEVVPEPAPTEPHHTGPHHTG